MNLQTVNKNDYTPEVDLFIERLRNKDWSALEEVPLQIKYFTGEIGLFESGLIKEE